jgi:hypothetical protein
VPQRQQPDGQHNHHCSERFARACVPRFAHSACRFPQATASLFPVDRQRS